MIPVLTSGKLLARNTIWNFVGQVAPLLVALLSIPYLISCFGIDRFGVLALVWVIIGYFSLFDLGLGRALTQMVAEKLGSGSDADVPSIAWICMISMLAMGLAGAIILGWCSTWLIYSVLKIPPELQAETRSAMVLLALSLPLVISTSGLRGLLEARQLFGMINAIRVPLGIFMYAGPFLVLPFSRSLVYIVAVLVAGRFIAWIAHVALCIRAFPALLRSFRINKSDVFPLFRFGGFITISNIIGPLMSYMDRFLIGSLASITAVAYYTTPYEIVTKLWIFPAAIVGVLFPAFSSCFKYDNPRAVQLFQAGIKYTLIGIFPLVFPLVMLAPEGMTLWLGPEFAFRSSRILQWMAIGIFLNCFAQIPFALIQAAGKPNWAALMYALQFPFYVLAIWLMLGYAGIEGVAFAWLIRVVIDSSVLFFLSERLMPGLSGMDRSFHIMIALALLLTIGACVPMPLTAKFAGIALVLPGFAAASWFTLLTQTERSFVMRGWRALRQIAINNRQAL